MICFKCQESSIIAYEFKTKCLKMMEEAQEAAAGNIKDDYEDHNLEDFIEYDDEEALCEEKEVNEIENINEEVYNTTDNEYVIEEVIEMEVNGDSYQFECRICNSSFKTKDSLRRHIIRHKTTNKLKCEFCPRQFFFQGELNFHLKQHFDPPPEVKCEICDKTFSSKSALNKHKLLHTDIKSFACSICEKKFRKKFTLKNHLLIHNLSEDKPYKCEIEDCFQSFNQLNVYKRHLKTIHNEKFFKCEYCKAESFDKKDNLRAHWMVCDAFLNSRK